MAKNASGASAQAAKFLNGLPEDIYKSKTADEILDLLKKDKAFAAETKKQALSDNTLKQLISKIKKQRGFTESRKSQKQKVTAASTVTTQETMTIDAAFDLLEEVKKADVDVGMLLTLAEKVNGIKRSVHDVLEAVMVAESWKRSQSQKEQRYLQLFD